MIDRLSLSIPAKENAYDNKSCEEHGHVLNLPRNWEHKYVWRFALNQVQHVVVTGNASGMSLTSAGSGAQNADSLSAMEDLAQ
ncbi:hypothetical protein MLD38_025503 [Melastoma candidum]|uniref:Uncharacterized protein n=1 Tax=Melastoma candidum TaxID=119954 RepID=A0ACB9NVA6_9MYRT|nr:hypothetical protein MLD38_025503 [Melastoma candidum]